MALYSFFTERVRDNLRIALAFSPIGDSFKNRLRIYPSLINCCTIDWFTAWPEDALIRVAENFIRTMNLSSEPKPIESDIIKSKSSEDDEEMIVERKLTPIEQSLVEMVMFFNTSVVTTSLR